MTPEPLPPSWTQLLPDNPIRPAAKPPLEPLAAPEVNERASTFGELDPLTYEPSPALIRQSLGLA